MKQLIIFHNQSLRQLHYINSLTTGNNSKKTFVSYKLLSLLIINNETYNNLLVNKMLIDRISFFVFANMLRSIYVIMLYCIEIFIGGGRPQASLRTLSPFKIPFYVVIMAGLQTYLFLNIIQNSSIYSTTDNNNNMKWVILNFESLH